MTTLKTLTRRLSAGMVAAALMTGAAFAQTSIIDSAIAKLRTEGFTQFQVGRTFFGRLKIDAISANSAREVIMNRATGEVLHEVDMTATRDAMQAEFAKNGGSIDAMGGTNRPAGASAMGDAKAASAMDGASAASGMGGVGGASGMGGVGGASGMGGAGGASGMGGFGG